MKGALVPVHGHIPEHLPHSVGVGGRGKFPGVSYKGPLKEDWRSANGREHAWAPSERGPVIKVQKWRKPVCLQERRTEISRRWGGGGADCFDLYKLIMRSTGSSCRI